MDNKPEMNIPEIWIGQLQNGMKILGMEYTELPVVQFTIILNSGMLCETADKSGVASYPDFRYIHFRFIIHQRWFGRTIDYRRSKFKRFIITVVQFTIILNSGMLCETADKSGVAMLTAAVMNSGTRMKTAEELEACFRTIGSEGNNRCFG